MACPGKWKHAQKPASAWWLNFDPYPFRHVETGFVSWRQERHEEELADQLHGRHVRCGLKFFSCYGRVCVS